MFRTLWTYLFVVAFWSFALNVIARIGDWEEVWIWSAVVLALCLIIACALGTIEYINYMQVWPFEPL